MRSAAIAALILASALGCKKKAIDAAEVELRKLVRAPFSLEVPTWDIKEDARDPAMGKHKVEKTGSGFVEIAWQGGDPMTLADIEGLVRGILEGFKIKIVDTSSETGDKQLRFQAIATLKGNGREVWLVMTSIQCQRTNVTVTTSVGTANRAAAEGLSKRVLANFTCLGDSPAKFSVDKSPPSTTVGPEFGFYQSEGATLLANPDGRMLYVLSAGGDNSNAIRKYPKKSLETLAGFMEITINKIGESRQTKGLGGIELSVVDASDGAGRPVAASGYYCREQRKTFTVIATTTSADNGATLAKLVTQFGCPGKGEPANKRKTACEVGVKELCGQ